MASSGSRVTLHDFCTELGYTDSPGFFMLSEDEFDLPDTLIGKQEHLGIDAVFGTYQGRTKRFQPIVYFEERSQSSELSLKQLYNNVWNEGLATLLIVVFPDRVKVYNCTQRPIEGFDEDIDEHDRLFETLELYQSSLEELPDTQAFNRPNIESRKFWKEHPGEFDRSNRVDQHLLTNLIHLKEVLTEDLPLSYANNLIIRSLFLLYLEDRDVIQKSFYMEEFDCHGYKEVLESKESTYQLFEEVKSRLNGDIFQFNENEIHAVTSHHLAKIQRFLQGTNLKTGQARLFPYRFDLIPIELISSIYEHFVGQIDTGGTYYTRPEMADYMIDETISRDIHEYERIVDPACGSGIFLVSTFRRLVEHEQSRSDDVGLDTLVEFLTDRIFGYDTNQEAIQITTFSLSLKLLEYIDNSKLWDDGFELPSLIGDSIQREDFFQVTNDERFDLVLGNPPWGSLSRIDSAADQFLDQSGYPIGNNESAQAFMWKAYDSIQEEGEVCFAVPARSVLFHKQSTVVTFREEFFETASVDTIVNLAPLRRSLFENATNPAAIITFGREPLNNRESIRYITPKSFDVESLRSVTVDTDHDVKYLSPHYQSFEHVWKTAMWGGKADLDLMMKLDSITSIDDLVDERDWLIGNGFEAGSSTYDQTFAPEVAEIPHLETGRIEPYYVGKDSLRQYSGEPYFKHPRDPSLYKPPVVTVRATATRRNKEPGASRGVKSAFHETPVSYRSRVVGIVGKEGDNDLLRLVNLVVNSSIAQYWLFLTTVGWGVARPTFRQGEILSIPFPVESILERKEELLERHDRIRDLVISGDRGEEYRILIEEIDEILYESFELTELEKGLIESRVRTTIDYYHERYNSRAVQEVDNELLDQYGEIVSNEINKFLEFSEVSLRPLVYQSLDERSPLNLISFELVDGDQPSLTSPEHINLEEELENLDSSITSNSLYHRRILEIYHEEGIHIIKPNEVRFWSIAQAVNDAPEFVGELIDRA